MTTLADRSIAALRTIHDELAALVPTLSADQLAGTSGAADWTVAQVLSHLGSGAEITRAGYRAALDGTPPPEQDFNQTVWDRWNALSPQAQADGFLQQDVALVEMLEALASQERETVRVKLGFLPEPLPMASVVGMRLHEAAQHAWDVQVALDPNATVNARSAEVLIEHFSGGLGFLLGFFGKPDALSEPALVQVEGSDVAIGIDEQISVTPAASAPTATFTGGTEAVIRLIGGRLKPGYTPADVAVTGNVTLDDLRRVFPGF